MRRFQFYLSSILFLLTPVLLLAGEPFTLEDCFKAALKRSEVLANQQELLAQAEENYRRAWGAMLPSVNGAYAYLYRNSPEFSGSGNNASSSGQQTMKIMATQPLFRGFGDFAVLNKTKALITAQEQSRQWAGMQLYRDVVQAFYTRLAVQDELNVIDNKLELYAQRVQDLQARVDIGRSRPTEILTIQAAKAILKAQREQVLGQLEVAKEVLAFLTGLGQDAQLNDTGDIPLVIEPLEVYLRELSARPDIQAALKNVEAFKSNLSVAKGAYWPSVDLVGNYYLQRPDLRKNGDWDLELAVTLPIFMGGIISSNLKTAVSQGFQSEIQLSQAQRLAAEEIRSLYHNLKADISQLTALEEAFKISQENYKANVKDYELNLVTNLDVLQAFTAYQDVEQSLVKMRCLAKSDYNQLEAAAARRLSLLEGLLKR